MKSLFQMSVIGVSEGLNEFCYTFINGVQKDPTSLYEKPTIVRAWFDKPIQFEFNKAVEVTGETFAFKDGNKNYFKIFAIVSPTGEIIKVSSVYADKKNNASGSKGGEV